MPDLHHLPTELLAQVVSYLPTAQSVASLRKTTSHLHRTVDDEAWKSFVWSKFPSLSVNGSHAKGDWEFVARSLTTLSRNLDRKAFLARYLEPKQYTKLPEFQPSDRWRLGRGQSMGYRPVVDSYEERFGEHFWQRREIVAWGAGSQLAIRMRYLDRNMKHEPKNTLCHGKDEYGLSQGWFLWKPPNAREGADDITSMKLLPEYFGYPDVDDRIHFIYCTDQGQPSLVSLPIEGRKETGDVRTQTFATNGGQVKALATTSSSSRLLATASVANTNVNRLSLFSIPTSLDSHPIPQSDSIILEPDENTALVWSTEFLSDRRLAVGLGPSVNQVHVYEVRPEGVDKASSRKISWTMGTNDSAELTTRTHKSSAYAIKPLPESFTATNKPGELFLTGGYDGVIRLHDLRLSRSVVSEYSIPSSETAIYSVATMGRERLVAGCAQHGALIIFDIRVTGGRNYAYHNLTDDRLGEYSSGSLIWLNPCSSYSNTNKSRERWRLNWRLAQSPVYSVSSPSPYSPFIYAGIESHVMELAFTSYTDKTPDPIFRRPRPFALNGANLAEDRGILNLPMNDEERGRPKLLRQRRLVDTRHRDGIEGYDERWQC